MEIERRFLIKDKNKAEELIKEYKETKKTITQDYIYSDIFTAIRKRKIEKNNEIKYFYTVKTGRKGFSVNEFEEEISKKQYDLLEIDEKRIIIKKDRFIIPYINNLKIELDLFHEKYEGVIFAEIEFEDEKQAEKTEIPEWFYLEIGDKVSNDMMSREYIDINKL